MKQKGYSFILLFSISFALLSLLCMGASSTHSHHTQKGQTSACINLHESLLKQSSCSISEGFFTLAFIAASFLPLIALGLLEQPVIPAASFLLLYLIIFYLSKIKFKQWLMFFEMRDNWAFGI